MRNLDLRKAESAKRYGFISFISFYIAFAFALSGIFFHTLNIDFDSIAAVFIISALFLAIIGMIKGLAGRSKQDKRLRIKCKIGLAYSTLVLGLSLIYVCLHAIFFLLSFRYGDLMKIELPMTFLGILIIVLFLMLYYKRRLKKELVYG